MSRPTWTTAEGVTLKIADMETSHIRNCIAMLERKWDELEEEDEIITGDHWSISGVVVIPGKEHFRPKLEALRAELDSRNAQQGKEGYDA